MENDSRAFRSIVESNRWKHLHSIPTGHPERIMTIKELPDGKIALGGGTQEFGVKIFDIQTGKMV